MVDAATGRKTDVSELEKERALRLKELERLNRLVTQLENQLDTLDYSSKAAELKEKSLNKRLDKALEDIQAQLADLDAQMEKIERYPRQNLSGQWIKTIHFRFPMYYNDNNAASCAVCFDMNGNFLPKRTTEESIVCLVRS